MSQDAALFALVGQHISGAGDYRAQRRSLAHFVLALNDWAYGHADELRRLEAEEQAAARDVQQTIADIRREERPARPRSTKARGAIGA